MEQPYSSHLVLLLVVHDPSQKCLNLDHCLPSLRRLEDHFVSAILMTDLVVNSGHERKMVKVHFELVANEQKKLGQKTLVFWTLP